MNNFFFSCIAMVSFGFASFAQQEPLVLQQVTSEELKLLKPVTGTMVYNTSQDAIYYFGNDGWFAFAGECVPKPVSPYVDSAYVENGQLWVFFSPVNPLLNYVVEDGGSKTLVTVNNSPAVITTTEIPKSISVRTKSKCGNSGPLGLFPVLIKAEE